MNEHGPETLIDAVRYFTDKKICHDYMVGIKWPTGTVTCPTCGGENIGTIATRSLYKCRGCKKQFSCKVGTLMEESRLPLSAWFVAIWCVANEVRVTVAALAEALGITFRSAWLMRHRIRMAMKTKTFQRYTCFTS